MEKKKNTKKGKRGCLITLVVLLVLFLIALIIFTFFINSILGRIERQEVVVETLSQEEVDLILHETEPEDADYTGETMDAIMPSEAVESVGKSENIINILLVGQDTYSYSHRSRTDTMILCTINREQKTLTMTSFMRDLYVSIPGYLDQRLNVPYVLGGFNKLYQTLETNFGVQVDHGIAVNFSSFPKVIEAVGGVTVDLSEAEARYMNRQNPDWAMSPGRVQLDGEQALCYSRIRKIDSDFNRTSRQREVLTAVLNKAKKLSLTQLYDLVDTLIPLVSTDMTDAEIIGTAMEIAPLLTDMTIVTQRIPVDGEYKSTMINNMAVLVPDREANRQFLEDTIGG